MSGKRHHPLNGVRAAAGTWSDVAHLRLVGRQRLVVIRRQDLAISKICTSTDLRGSFIRLFLALHGCNCLISGSSCLKLVLTVLFCTSSICNEFGFVTIRLSTFMGSSGIFSPLFS